MSLMGIVGLKEGYEKAIEQANHTPHLQIQLMLKDSEGNINFWDLNEKTLFSKIAKAH